MEEIIGLIQSFYGIEDLTEPIRVYPYPQSRGIACMILRRKYSIQQIADRIGINRRSVYDRIADTADEIRVCPNSDIAKDYKIIMSELNQINQTI